MRILLTLSAMLMAIAGACRLNASEEGSVRQAQRVLVRSARSGNWSDVATWEGGRLPAVGDSVLVRNGHEVVYDIVSQVTIRVVKVAGTLRFAHERETRLDVGLLRIERGDDVSEEGFDCDTHAPAAEDDQPRPALIVGSPEQPIAAGHSAVIRLVYCEGMSKDSCPALVNCGGHLSLQGAPLRRTWVKLAKSATLGDTKLTLVDTVEGWRVGDRVLVPSTHLPSLFERGDNRRGVIPSVRQGSHTEERTLTAIDGDTLTLDQPLDHPHRVEGDFRGEVANLSRNIIVESADPQGVRGHTMVHANSTAAIAYAEFRHLGKRGVLGRYSLHFHLCRDTSRGSYVIGASIHDSDNRWLTVHGTDYLAVRDCVGYNCLGHGYFLEDGTETRNIFDRNLAVQARHDAPLPKQMLPYDENEGAGFWWANSLNSFTRNVAAECDQYGFRFEATKTVEFDPVLEVPQADGELKPVDIRTLSFVRFDDNEAHSHRRFAFNLGGIRHVSDAADHQALRKPGADLSRIQGGDVQGVGPDTEHPFVIRRFRVWASNWVFHGGSPNVLIDGLDAYDCGYGIFKTRMDGHEYRRLNMECIDTAEIFEPWGNSTIQEDYWRYLDPVDDLPPSTVITHCRRGDGSTLLVRGVSSDNGTIKKVIVNGREAVSLRDEFAEWEVAIESAAVQEATLVAHAVDARGNVEQRPHRVLLRHLLTD